MRTDRRQFLLGLAASARLAKAAEKKLLLPSDQPDKLGFRLMWYNPTTPIDQATYTLQIDGLVDKPIDLAIADLRKLKYETQSSRLKCVQGWSARTNWGGFRFAELIEIARPAKAAKAVRIECADRWYEYFTLEEITQPHVLMVLDMAGEPLADRHGAPLRVLDPTRYGYKSAKLVTGVTFVAEGKGSMACDIGGPYYSPSGEIKPGYDTPLDLGPNVRKKINGGEITEY